MRTGLTYFYSSQKKKKGGRSQSDMLGMKLTSPVYQLENLQLALLSAAAALYGHGSADNATR